MVRTDAGGLDRWLQVLELRETDGGLQWSTVRGAWGSMELSPRRELFSTAGVGAQGCTMVLRTQPLTLDNALRLGEQHICLTSILPGSDRGRMEIRGALVTTMACAADADRSPMGISFPGILTEKYVGHEEVIPHGVVTRRWVLVTPKRVMLAPGSWVLVGKEHFEVLIPHELDPHRNEYEIRKETDC